MIADEVLTFARTGEWFGSYDSNEFVRPDIAVIGKSLSMGIIPVSMVISRRDITMHPYRGISTFDLTPLMCGVISTGIDEIVERNLLIQSKRKGEILLQGIKRGVMIKDVRGRGLMIGIELTDAANPHYQAIREKLLERGLNTDLMDGRKREGINKTIRLSPPLIVTESDCEEAVRIINEVQGDFTKLQR